MEQSEGRIGILEMRVDRLETWAGPGQAEATAAGLLAVRTELAAVRSTQDKHSSMLRTLTRDVTVLKADVAELKSDVAQLKTDVAELKSDVAQLKTDVAELKSDVAQLKTDVAQLKSDVADLKAAVHEILRRLPAAS